MQAGCCVVRTSSGDWAEAWAQEVQKTQEAQKHEASETNPPVDSNQTPNSRCRSCFTSTMCLGDDGTYEPLVEIVTEGAEPTAQAPTIQLHCCMPDENVNQQLRQLLENHVPHQFRTSIR